MDDPKLLTAFPKPPSGPPSAAAPSILAVSPRPSDFGFIQVGLYRENYDDSLSDDPSENIDNSTILAPTSASPPQVYNDDFQLVLDNPSQLYSPSETITGYIIGWRAAAHVHIILEACAKTYVREAKIQFKDRAPLLYECVQLTRTTNDIVPRFCITIPEGAARGLEKLHKHAPSNPVIARYWTSDWPTQEPYEDQAGHPLPPSLVLPLRNLHASGWGHVSYKVIAVRLEPNTTTGKLTPNACCQVPLQITTRRLSSTRIEELLSNVHSSSSELFVQTAQLSKERALSLREQLRDAFDTTTSAFYFKGYTSTPKTSVPGASLKVTITVAILPPPPGHLYNFPVPNITVARLAYRVRSYTGLRVQRLSSEKQKLPKLFTFKQYELDTRQSPNGATFVPRNGAFDGQSCVITIVLPENLLPSFKTYNLWRSYILECEVTFSVAGKEVSTKSKSDLNIVARATRSANVPQSSRPEVEQEDDPASLQIATTVASMGLRQGVTVGVQ